MKNLFPIIFLAIFLMGCGSSKDIVFKEVSNLKFQSIDRTGTVKITADAIMNNPRRIGAKVIHIDCDVMINGTKMAEVSQIKETKVPKRSDFSVPIETSISLKKVLGSMGSLAKSILGDRKIDIKMKGTVKAKVLGKKIKIPFDYDETTKIKL